MPRIKKEMFHCDGCGLRKRLSSSQRHWCDLCTLGSPIEMNTVRFRGFAQASPTRLETISPRLQRAYHP
jgi:hypothetical protein